jgi:hypothetical protein
MPERPGAVSCRNLAMCDHWPSTPFTKMCCKFGVQATYRKWCNARSVLPSPPPSGPHRLHRGG